MAVEITRSLGAPDAFPFAPGCYVEPGGVEERHVWSDARLDVLDLGRVTVQQGPSSLICGHVVVPSSSRNGHSI